jgi:GNAT superfamily N-acetyltransferase
MRRPAADTNVFAAPEPLAPDHELDAFESGVATLDEWLKRRARRNEADGASRTFVLCAGRRVVGYYSLAAGSVLHSAATGKVRRNMPDPVPALLLARLAIDRAWHGKGLGADLLSDAVLRAIAAAETIGVRAILVHAISDQAKAFYEKHGFRSSPIEPMTLMVTIDEARRMLNSPIRPAK